MDKSKMGYGKRGNQKGRIIRCHQEGKTCAKRREGGDLSSVTADPKHWVQGKGKIKGGKTTFKMNGLYRVKME